jgi:hypothetical protein
MKLHVKTKKLTHINKILIKNYLQNIYLQVNYRR